MALASSDVGKTHLSLTAASVAATASALRISSRSSKAVFWKVLRFGLSTLLATSAAAGLAAFLSSWLRRRKRLQAAEEQLRLWEAKGPAKEPIVEFEVPVEHGLSGDDVDTDVVDVPVGLLFECDRLQSSIREVLIPGSSGVAAVGDGKLDVELVHAVKAALSAEVPEGNCNYAVGGLSTPVRLPWIDLAALAQLTYWYDRRPRSFEEEQPVSRAPSENGNPEDRLTEAKFGRWTKKINKEHVVYGTVALRYRTRCHLGAQIFRRPAGVDITRLTTLRRAAALCGHPFLLDLVQETMEKLQPQNVASIPWSEVKKHNTQEDAWLMIDGKVYDTTPFLSLHPGGGVLIVEACGYDATSIFEKTHGEGLRYSLRLLNQFFIGVCPDPEKASPALPDDPVATPEFLATLRSITGALHTFDEAKATGEAQGILR